MPEPRGSYRASVLVVDDEASIRDSLRMILEYEGYRVDEAGGGAEALARVARAVRRTRWCSTSRCPRSTASSCCAPFRERGYEMPVLMISGHADVSTAVEADPPRRLRLLREAAAARARAALACATRVEADRLRREAGKQRQEPDELIGTSLGDAPAARDHRAGGADPGDGAGHRRERHRQGAGGARHPPADRRAGSGRSSQVNCAAIPEELIESELFGHEKGSFTGAVRKQTGKFVAADGGTIFLDEIGDMSPRTQAKVLRVLQSGDVEPVGSEKVARVDVRVVAATNRDLEAEIARRALPRGPLLPPQRHPGAHAGAARASRGRAGAGRLLRAPLRGAQQLPAQDASPRTPSSYLQSLPWKGNVREFKNLVERLLILSPGDDVRREDVLRSAGGAQPELSEALLALRTLREFRDVSEKMFLLQKLEENDWNVTQTARAIDTPRSNLYKKMEQYEIKREGAAPEAE